MEVYKVVYSPSELQEMIEHAQNSELLAYDTETTGLNVRKDKVIGFSISGKVGYGYYLPLFKWNGSELEPIWSMDVAEKVLNIIKSKKLIMHNASYDVRITKNSLNIDLLDSLYCDTILLKHACDEERPFGLKDIAKKIQHELGLDVSAEANKEQLDMIESIKANGGAVTKECYELFKADVDKIGIYACKDTDLTLRVFNYYSELLTKEGLDRFFYKDETMPLMKEVTIPMESRGVPVDVELLKAAQAEISVDIAEVERQIHELIEPHLGLFYDWYVGKELKQSTTGEFPQLLCEYADLDLPKTKAGRYSIAKKGVESLPDSEYKEFLLGNAWLSKEVVADIKSMWLKRLPEHPFNISSKHHLAKLFFDTLKEPPVTKTDKGNPQMNDLFLDSVKDKYEFVPLIRVYNKLNKLKSAYIDRFLERQEDGIFYPSYNQHRTISGRYGSDLQQLNRPFESAEGVHPAVYKYTNMVRKFFISGDDHAFIDADYVSLEPFVFSHVSNDNGLKAIFLNGHDFYSTVAIATEGLEGLSADKKADNYLGKVNKNLRQKAKAYSLGIPYGMEEYALGKTLNIPQSEAKRLINQYLNAYPELKKWMERSNEMCVTQGYVKSEAGRIRHFPKAPKIWYSHGKDILDSLKLWSKYHERPKLYQQMKFLRKEVKNSLNNAKNFQIQSLAASITNRACIAINRELKRLKIDGYVCAQVHDQIITRVPEEHAERCRKIVQYLMENTYKISLPLSAPAEIGKDFYEAH